MWRTTLIEIRSDRPTEELELIPGYYRDVEAEHHLWLKLRSFEPLDPNFAEEHLMLDGSKDPDSIPRALRGQQSFLYVRFKSEGGVVGSDDLASSVDRFRKEYPYTDDEKLDTAVESLALAAECRPALSPEA